MKANEVVITMLEFRDKIGDDEQMLEFAAAHLDLPDDALVRITLPKTELQAEYDFGKVTFEVVE